MDDDLQRRLRSLADEASPRPGSEDVVLKRANMKRRLAGAVAGLVLVALIGALAGAATLLGDRGIKPAPGPEETSECVSADYDLAVFVPEQDFHDKMVEIEEHLRQHDAVASFEFVSAADAMEEYLRENPDHAGPAPTQARRSQYRVTVEAGADPDRVAQNLAKLGDGAYVPAVDCPPSQPQQKFARYSFEVEEGNASASGVLEVNSENPSICLSLTNDNIIASHLLIDDPDHPRGRSIIFTFFDPNDGEEGADVSFSSRCFSEEQLDVYPPDLQLLVDEPERFAVDFHRGPNDEPGLIAELVPVGDDDPCATGPTVTDIPTRIVTPGERVTFSGRCFQDLRLHRKTKVFLTATVDEEGRPLAKTDLAAGGESCDLVAEAHSEVSIFEDGGLRGWLIVPDDGTCLAEQSAESSVALGPGTYHVAMGCRACAYANLRVDPGATPSASEPAGARALVRVFMQRRVEGAAAEESLDRQGRAEFAPGGGLAPLYPDPPLQDFQIEFVDDVGNGTYEVGVSLVFQERSYGETLFVRERNGELVISGGRPGLEGP